MGSDFSLRDPISLPRQADADDQRLALWLHGHSSQTQAAYRADVVQVLAAVAKPRPLITLGDVQAFADQLAAAAGLAVSSQARKLSAVKSLLSFAHRVGYTPFNVGAALRLPKIKNTLAERIVSEAAIGRLLALEPKPRNHALLRLLHAGGLRVSEVVALRWRDLQERHSGGQVTVFGKGGTTRVVVLGAETWRELVALRSDAGADDPLFRSQKGGALSRQQAWQIVKTAAARAGLPDDLSPHWLRHAHASHAMDRGAPIALVQATLGHASVQTTGRYLHGLPEESSGRYLPI